MTTVRPRALLRAGDEIVDDRMTLQTKRPDACTSGRQRLRRLGATAGALRCSRTTRFASTGCSFITTTLARLKKLKSVALAQV